MPRTTELCTHVSLCAHSLLLNKLLNVTNTGFFAYLSNGNCLIARSCHTLSTELLGSDVVQNYIPNADFRSNEKAIYNKVDANIMRLPLTYSRMSKSTVSSGQTIDIRLCNGHAWRLQLEMLIRCTSMYGEPLDGCPVY